MGEREHPYLGLLGEGRGLLRGRMAGLGGSVGLIMRKRRLMDEHVGVVRGDPHRVARHRVPGDHELAPGTARAHHLLGPDAPDRLPALHASELGTGRQPERGRLHGVEGTGALRLVQRVAEHRTPVTPGHRGDRVPVTLKRLAGLELREDQLKAHPARQPERTDDELPETWRTVDRERPLARAEIERLEQSRQSEPVVGVEMGDEDLVQVEQADRADELALGALAAVEQDPVPPAPHEQGGQTTAGGRNRAGGADEKEREVHLDSVCQSRTMS